MLAKLRPKLTYANVVSTLCLFILLGGSSYAAVKLGKNAVKTKNIAANAVTSPKVKDRSLRARDFATGQLPAGAQGPAGVKGDSGANGSQGPPGEDGQDMTAPAGAVMFFDLADCPAGWTELASARGRYLVGLPPGGTLGGTQGTALTNLENRPVGQHNHAITDSGHSHKVRTAVDGGFASGTDKIGLVEGDPTFATSPSTSTATTGITVGNEGSVAGTTAPYIQLRACKKD